MAPTIRFSAIFRLFSLERVIGRIDRIRATPFLRTFSSTWVYIVSVLESLVVWRCPAVYSFFRSIRHTRLKNTIKLFLATTRSQDPARDWGKRLSEISSGNLFPAARVLSRVCGESHDKGKLSPRVSSMCRSRSSTFSFSSLNLASSLSPFLFRFFALIAWNLPEFPQKRLCRLFRDFVAAD